MAQNEKGKILALVNDNGDELSLLINSNHIKQNFDNISCENDEKNKKKTKCVEARFNLMTF